MIGLNLNNKIFITVILPPKTSRNPINGVTTNYTNAAVESIINEIISYTTFSDSPKELIVQNVQSSISNVSNDTLINGTIATITGNFAEKIMPTNPGWFTPKKFKSSFVSKYAKKVHFQTVFQGIISVYDSIISASRG